MSWNKNTINLSKLDAIAVVLDLSKIKYKIEKLGEVIGMGLNDEFDRKDKYELRSLTYKDAFGKIKVMAEQICRNKDCDSDDFIFSNTFDDKLPKNFKLEVFLN